MRFLAPREGASPPSQLQRFLLWPPGGSRLGLTRLGSPGPQLLTKDRFHQLQLHCPTIYKVQNSHTAPKFSLHATEYLSFQSRVPTHTGFKITSSDCPVKVLLCPPAPSL